MSKENQNNDSKDESLNDEKNDISNNDQPSKDSQPSEDTIETVEEIEEVYEEIADPVDDDAVAEDDDAVAEIPADEQTDQGFEQQPVAALSQSSSGGKGMAGTAMGLSLLALAGTGYNWYDTNSSKSADAGDPPQAAVDYSSDIASIQEQINALMQSQEELTAIATTAQAGSDGAAEEVEQVAAADESASQDDMTAQSADTTQSTTSVDETAQADTAEAATDEAAEEMTDEQVSETEAVTEQDQESGTGSAASDAETADTETAGTETTETETTETETALTQADTESTVMELDQPESGQVAEAEMVSGQDQQTDTQSDTGSIASTESEIILDLDQQAQVQAQVDALTSTLPSGDDIKNMAMEQVSVVLDDARKRLGLSEVAQLLSIGEQRLALASDVGGAQAAFGMAQQRLSEISDPVVEPVRESISSNLDALESLEVVDKNALTQELTNLSESVDTLPFKPLETLSESAADEQEQAEGSAESTQDSEQAASSETPSGGEASSLEGAGEWLKSISSKVGSTIGDVGSGIAGDLKGMVTIQKTGPLSDVLLAPEQQYFVRENIKLQLGSAQRAVLLDNTGVYKQSLSQAQSFLNDFFDTENDDVKSVSARLNDLEQINLELDLPDVSAASASLSEVLKQLPSVGGSETNTN